MLFSARVSTEGFASYGDGGREVLAAHGETGAEAGSASALVLGPASLLGPASKPSSVELPMLGVGASALSSACINSQNSPLMPSSSYSRV